MNKKYKLLIVIFIVVFVTLLLSSTFISQADTKQAPIVIRTTNNTEFAIEVSKLKNIQSQVTRAAGNKTRLLVIYNSEFDYSSLEGLEIIIFNTKKLCVLQFDSMTNAQIAYDTMCNWNEIQSVEFDQMIHSNSISIKQNILAVNNKYNSWGVKAINIDKYVTYIKNFSHKKIVIAVIDSGVYIQHPFLASRIEKNGYDFVSTDDEDGPNDENGHGTHVAGIIIDCTPNLNNITIMPVRVLDEKAIGWMSDIANGVLYAADNGAEIINLSLSGSHSSYLDSAISNVISKGVVVVCASGNEDVDIDKEQVCPAHIENAITVGAVDKNLGVEIYSNYGKKLDVVAPGGRIKSCALNGSYIINSGTSMAASHVSACAALLKIKYPNKNCMEISSILKRSAEPDYPKKYYGKGIVNMKNLLTSISHQKIEAKSKHTYTGEAIRPFVTVSRNGESLFNGEDYTISYKNNVKIGTASIIIKGRGSYSGKKTIYFKIVPQKTTIKSLKAKKKGFTVKWKKQTIKTSGYQIQYATNKKFKNAHKITIKSKDKTSYKVAKLKSKKKYYVRVRTYKSINGKKYYSFWSDIGTIKTK